MDITLLLAWIITNFLDIIIVYFLGSKLVKQQVTIDTKRILIGLGYGIVFGLLTYLTDRSVLYQVLAVSSWFVILALLAKKKFAKTIILFLLVYSVSFMFQMLLLAVIVFFNLEWTMTVNIVILSLTALFSIVVYKKIPVDRAFTFVEKSIGLTLLALVGTTLFFLISIASNHNSNMNLLLMFLLMIVNLCDLLVTYLISLKLVKRLVIIDFKNVLIAFLYAATFGIISYLTDRSIVFQTLAITAQFMIVYLNIKRNFASSLIAFALSYTLFSLFQGLFLLPILFFNLETTIMTTVAVQILTAIFAIIIYKFVSINTFFAFIEKHIMLKFVILILALIVVPLVLYYNISVSGDPWVMLGGVGLIIGIFIALCTLGREIYRMTYTKPLKQHDLEVSFHGMLIKAYREEDHQQIKSLEILGKEKNFDLNFDFKLGETRDNILEFIKQKQAKYKHEIEIRSDIVYYKDHHSAGIDVVIKLLGILLDNALETDTKKPIMIEIRTDLGNINIEVSNEYQLTAPDAITRMFDKGFSTKKNGNGFGLDNLYRTVKEFSGKVTTDYDFNETMQTDYLTFLVEI